MTISDCSGEGNSDLSLEDVLLERFFLEPGMLGPIRSVHIADDDLMDIFGSSDIEGARTAFIKTLPHPILLTTILSGETSTCRRGSRPSFIRVLIFLSWMQTSSLRPKGLRNFREILDLFLDHKFYHMHGLNRMWEELADYLTSEYGIELVLPASLPHPHIGRTVRLAFPTWRDNDAMRRLRSRIDAKEQLLPLVVSNRIKTGSDFSNETSLWYNFEVWEQARLRRDSEAPDLPFWRAWTAIVSEVGGHDEIEALEDEYGGVSLSIVAPDGKSRPVVSLEKAARLRPSLTKDLRRGLVLMEALGFGRYRSTNAPTRTLLVDDSHMSGVDDTNAKQVRQIYGGWNLVTFRRPLDAEEKTKDTKSAVAGWKGGIRVGSAYLGRVPLTPSFGSNVPDQVVVKLNDESVPTRVVAGTVELDAGTFDGTLTAVVGGKAIAIRVLPSAVEHPEHRRKVLTEATESSEDGVLFGSWPTLASGRRDEWGGRRHEPAPEFEAIGEALYAKSIRGMPMSEAIDIIGRGTSRCSSAPTPWDILKSFSDGGWFDLAVLRNYPARKLLQPPLRYLPSSYAPNAGDIVGPMVTASRERIAKCAETAGVAVQSLGGLTPWGPRYHRVRADSADALEEFLSRAELLTTTPAAHAKSRDQWGDQVSLHHYAIEAKWQPTSGFFNAHPQTPSAAGLYRMASSREADPKLYAIHDEERFLFTYRSPSLAVLSYAHMAGIAGASVDGDRLLRTGARVQLPASWARWVAARTGCNGGPVLQGETWGYAYASDSTVASVLQSVLSLKTAVSRDTSWDNFLASRSRAGRHIALADGHLGRARGLPVSGAISK